jgi:hypothetical protein
MAVTEFLCMSNVNSSAVVVSGRVHTSNPDCSACGFICMALQCVTSRIAQVVSCKLAETLPAGLLAHLLPSSTALKGWGYSPYLEILTNPPHRMSSAVTEQTDAARQRTTTSVV